MRILIILFIGLFAMACNPKENKQDQGIEAIEEAAEDVKEAAEEAAEEVEEAVEEAAEKTEEAIEGKKEGDDD